MDKGNLQDRRTRPPEAEPKNGEADAERVRQGQTAVIPLASGSRVAESKRTWASRRPDGPSWTDGVEPF